MSIVIRFIPAFHKWYLCHANSYQNALGSKENGFLNRDTAVKKAQELGMVIEYHDYDNLQVHS